VIDMFLAPVIQFCTPPSTPLVTELELQDLFYSQIDDFTSTGTNFCIPFLRQLLSHLVGGILRLMSDWITTAKSCTLWQRSPVPGCTLCFAGAKASQAQEMNILKFLFKAEFLTRV
jgi:hypothetical protein